MGVLEGKVAIVTGASRGIGAEIARCFGRAGAAVALTGQVAYSQDLLTELRAARPAR